MSVQDTGLIARVTIEDFGTLDQITSEEANVRDLVQFGAPKVIVRETTKPYGSKDILRLTEDEIPTNTIVAYVIGQSESERFHFFSKGLYRSFIPVQFYKRKD